MLESPKCKWQDIISHFAASPPLYCVHRDRLLSVSTYERTSFTILPLCIPLNPIFNEFSSGAWGWLNEALSWVCFTKVKLIWAQAGFPHCSFLNHKLLVPKAYFTHISQILSSLTLILMKFFFFTSNNRHTTIYFIFYKC